MFLWFFLIIVDGWCWWVVAYGQYIGCAVSWDPDDPNWEARQRVCNSPPERLLTCCWYFCWQVGAGEEVYQERRKELDTTDSFPQPGNRMQPFHEHEPQQLGDSLSRHHLWADATARCILHTYPPQGCWNFSSSLMASKGSEYILQLGRNMTAFHHSNIHLKWPLTYLPFSWL